MISLSAVMLDLSKIKKYEYGDTSVAKIKNKKIRIYPQISKRGLAATKRARAGLRVRARTRRKEEDPF